MRRASLLWLALAAVALSGVVTESGADFTRSSASPGNAFVAAADFNTVAVSITDPGTPLRGTVAEMGTPGHTVSGLGTFAAGEKHRYQFTVQLDSSAGNVYQGDTSSVEFDWNAA